MMQFLHDGMFWEIAVVVILLLCVVLAINKSERWRISDEAMAQTTEETVPNTRAELNADALRFIALLTEEEQNTFLITAVNRAISRRFEVFATAYRTTNTAAENALAFQRLEHGITDTMAAAYRLKVKYGHVPVEEEK